MDTQQSNNFNPEAYGAVPVATPPTQGTPTFNPQAYGAVPVAAKPTLSQIGPNLVSALESGVKTVVGATERDLINPLETPVQLLAEAAGRPDPYASNPVPGTFGSIPSSPATPAGFAVKAGQVGQLLTSAIAPEEIGALKLGALGAGMGASNALASGVQDPAQVTRDAIWGGLFGTTLGVGGNFLSHLGEQSQLRTGVAGVAQDAISKTDPSLLAQYINAGMNHGETLESLGSKTPIGIMEDEFDRRANILTDTLIPQAGQKLGEAKAAGASQPIVLRSDTGPVSAGSQAANSLLDDINSKVMAMTGHGFGLSGDVEEGLPGLTGSGQRSTPTVYQLPGREVQLSTKESGQLEDLYGYLQRLVQKPTAGVAADLVTNIDRDIGKWKDPQFGSSDSPVIGALKYARGAIQRTVKASSPVIEDALNTYSGLMNLKDDIARQAGREGQSAALAMRRVLSGDKNSAVVPILNQLDAVTAPFRGGDTSTLIQHSVLGKWATDMFGNETTKQLFAKGVAEGNNMASGLSSVLGWPKQFATRQLDKLFSSIAPNPADFAISVARGEPYSMNPVTRLLDKELESARAIPIIRGISNTLKSWGVSAHNLEPAAEGLFKVWIMQKLTQPKQPGFPLQTQGVPNAILPPGIPQPNVQASAPSSPLASAQPQSVQQAQQRSLTPPSTGQGMSAALRKGGLDTIPNGMNLQNTNMSLT